jgi:predicted RNA methylase
VDDFLPKFAALADDDGGGPAAVADRGRDGDGLNLPKFAALAAQQPPPQKRPETFLEKVTRHQEAGEDWDHYAKTRVPFGGIGASLGHYGKLKLAADRVREGTHTDDDLDVLARFEAGRRRDEDKSFLRAGFDIATQAPAGVIEYLATGGAGPALKVAAREGAEKLIERAVANRVAQQALKVGVDAASRTATTVGVAHAAKNLAEQAVPDIGGVGAGGLPGVGPAKETGAGDVARAFAGEFVSQFSNVLGGGVAGINKAPNLPRAAAMEFLSEELDQQGQLAIGAADRGSTLSRLAAGEDPAKVLRDAAALAIGTAAPEALARLSERSNRTAAQVIQQARAQGRDPFSPAVQMQARDAVQRVVEEFQRELTGVARRPAVEQAQADAYNQLPPSPGVYPGVAREPAAGEPLAVTGPSSPLADAPPRPQIQRPSEPTPAPIVDPGANVQPVSAPTPPPAQPDQPAPDKTPAINSAPPAISSETPPADLPSQIADLVRKGTPPDAKTLFEMANAAFGGTRAVGKYGPSDAYDALEAGVNLSLQGQTRTDVGPDEARATAERLRGIVAKLPTQTNRSGEKDSMQQFSTPPDYAYVAAWVANPKAGTVSMEPSAGTGSIAVHLQNAGTRVHVNELSKRRGELLRPFKFAGLTLEDAEQIDNILDPSVQPETAVMNPPFSRAGARMGDKMVLGTGAAHVEQMLKRLAPGGRLVAIVGRGMGMDSPRFKGWWNAIGKEYNVRANVEVAGDKVYAKYGTAFDTRILVIDKVAPSGAPVVGGRVESTADLIDALQGVRDDRYGVATQQPPAEPTRGEPAQEAGPGPGPANAAQPPTGPPLADDAGGAAGQGAVGGLAPRVEAAGRGDAAGPAGADAGDAPPAGRPPRRGKGRQDPGSGPAPAAGRPAQPDSGRPGVGPDAAGGSPVRPDAGDVPVVRPPVGERVAAEFAAREASKDRIGDSTFEAYKPRLRVEGAKGHPASLVETAAMATVDPPKADYKPHLPKDLIRSGKISDVQVESVIYAGFAHSKFLPHADGEKKVRQGWLLGDGTGVGKGRQIAAIILDNFMQGRRRAVWVSEKAPLFNDAKRDWSGIGQDPGQLFDFKAFRKGGPETGILFTTYDTLKSKPKEESAKTNVQQIAEWLGEDFDGVVVFDEAHNMGNSVETKGGRGLKKASQKALAGVELQTLLPNARVVYVSATAATEVSNLVYADRLGLWGRGTPFPTKEAFIADIDSGGVAAMELVARDMKAMGKYLARNIAYDDGTEKGTVRYDRLSHELTADQRAVYNKMAEGWQHVLNNLGAVLEATGAADDSRAKSAALSQFWGAQQRFFNQVITAIQTPTVIRAIEKDLAEGRSAVVSLVNTMEAATERALADREEGSDLEDLDITPRDILMQYVEQSFPTAQYEEYQDENGNTRSRPVKDAAGNVVHNRQAVAMRDRLLDELGSLRVPESPMDMIVNHFGPDKVAEVTGRKRRVVTKPGDDGTAKKEVEKRPGSANTAEADTFQAGKKRILIFSEAGGTGRSYHADLAARNQQQRSFYMLQAGWRADKAMQAMGRVHRSNQAQAPIYHLVQIEELKGQKRFLSTIARRLNQLGALTKGERRAASSGMLSAADNLEGKEASDALRVLFRDIIYGKVPGLSLSDFEQQTGLRLTDEKGGERADLPPMSQFLNRMLSMSIENQDKVFSAFENRLQQKVEQAAADGSLDEGTETYRADGITKVSESTIYTHDSGAETKYVKLSTRHRNTPVTFEAASKTPELIGFVRNNQSGRVYAARQWLDRTDARSGSIIPQYQLIAADASKHPVPAHEVTGGDKYTRLDKSQAERLWGEAVAKVPEFTESDLHLVTGSMLPIWDRLRGQTKVYRLQTDDGERMLGRVLPASQVAATLRAFGQTPDAPKITAAEAFGKVAGREGTLVLANGWEVKAARVQGENRVEIIGPDYRHGEELRGDGVFTERINYATRYFIPAGEDGARVLANVTKSRPIAEVRDMAGESMLTGGRPAVPTKPGAVPGRRVGAHEIARTLVEGLSVPMHLSKMPQGQASYQWHPERIRVTADTVGDLAYVTHEAAHHLDNTTDVLKRLTAAERSELKALDYVPQREDTREGFAEFVRHYLTTDDAKSLAPQFHQRFERWLATAEAAPVLARVREMIDRWREQGSQARVESNLVFAGRAQRGERTAYEAARGRLARVGAKLHEAMIDKFHFLHEFTEEAKARGAAFPPGSSPAELARYGASIGPTLAKRAFEEGVFSVTDYRNKLGPSLKEALKDVKPDDYKAFVSWLYARHAVESWDKGHDPGVSRADALDVRDNHGKPEWEDAAQKLTDFNNALITMLAQAGAISWDSANAMTRKWDTYVPLMRVRPDAVDRGFSLGRTLVDVGADPKRRKAGGSLQVIDPLESMLARTARLYQRAANQMVMNKVVETARETEGLGGWVVPEPPGSQATRVQAAEAVHALKDALEAFGLDEDALQDLSEEDAFTIFRPDYQYKGDQPIARVMEDGRPRLYRLNPDLYRFVKGMDEYRLPWFLDATLGRATRMVRLGATGLNPDFALRNVANDLMSQFMQTRGNAATAAPRALASIGRFALAELNAVADPAAALYKQSGGELAHQIGFDRNAVAEGVRDLLANDAKRRAYNVLVPVGYEDAPPLVKAGRALAVEAPLATLRGLGHVAAALSKVSEVGPRLAEFKDVLKRGGYDEARIARGDLPPPELLREAALAAKDVTVDFSRSGTIGQKINQVIPFFNARVQGLDKFVRTWRGSLARTALRASALAAATLAHWWLRKDDDDYKEAPAWLKYGFWEFTDDAGKPILRVPRTHEWGWTVSAGVQAMADFLYEKDPGAFADYGRHALASANMLALPPGVKEGVEVTANKDFFRDKPIVPQSKQDLEPRDQASDWNTPLAKAIGDYLNVSPAKIEHVLQGVTGGGYRRAENVAQLAAGKKLEAPDLPLVGGLALRKDYSASLDEFYKRHAEAERARGSLKLRGLPDPNDGEFRKLDAYKELMTAIRKEAQGMERRGESAADRDSRFEGARKYEIGLARAALGEEPLKRYPNPLDVPRSELPPAVRRPVEDMLTRAAIQYTDPPPRPRPGEPADRLQQRREQHAEQARRGEALLRDAKATAGELRRLLAERERRMGRRATTLGENGLPTELGLRLRRLEKIGAGAGN